MTVYYNMYKNINKYLNLNKILIIALTIRILALFVISLSGSWGNAFLGVGIDADDWRYIEGGLYYIEHARSVIDLDVFTKAYERLGDGVGYHVNHPFIYATGWYWIVCVLMYVTKTKWSVSILNVVLSVLSIIYIYKFANLVYGTKTAKTTSYLFALLPYPVIFCNFAYKEQLAMFCTFFILFQAVRYRYYKELSLITILLTSMIFVVFMTIRSGASIIFLFLVFVIMFADRQKFVDNQAKYIMVCSILFIISCVLCVQFNDVISHKINYYVTSYTSYPNTIVGHLLIKDLSGIYKLPFAYAFSIIMPMKMDAFCNLSSWSDVVACLNLCMIPISVGATLFLIKKKPDKIVFWGCFSYYSIYLISSLNIFRHYSSLLPLQLMAFSHFLTHSQKNDKIFFISGIVFAYLLLLIYFMWRN